MTESGHAKPGGVWRGEERRRGPRRETRLTVSCRLMGEGERPETEAEGVDVGLRGVAFISRRYLEVGAPVQLTLRSAEGQATVVEGVVRRCVALQGGQGYEVGVELTAPMSPASQAVGVAPNWPSVRRHVRVRVRLPARYRRSLLSRWRAGTLHDIGAGGVLLVGGRDVSAGDRIRIAFRLPDRGPVRTRGRVVNVRPIGDAGTAFIHVSFERLSDRARALIAGFVVEQVGAEADVRGLRVRLGPWRARRETLLRTGLAVACTLAATLFAHALGSWTPFGVIRGALGDMGIRLRGVRPPRSKVVLLVVDEPSVAKLRAWGQPYPDTGEADARLVRRLSQWGAAVVAFARPLPASSGAEWTAAAHGSPRIVWGTFLGRQISGAAGPLEEQGACGFLNLLPDVDMRVRRAPLLVRGHRSLPLVVAEARTGQSLLPGREGDASLWVNYRGPAGTFPAVPYWQAAEGAIGPEVLSRYGARSERELFSGSVVLVGAAGAGQADPASAHFPTPFSAGAGLTLSALEVYATVADNLLAGDALAAAPRGAGTLASLATAGLCSVLFLLARPWRAVAAFAAVLLALLGGAVWLSAAGWVVDPVTPILAVVSGGVASLGVGATLATWEKTVAVAERDLLRAEREAQRRDLRKARVLVEALLPDLSRFPLAQRLQAGAFYNPAEKVGGDIYDLRRLGPDQAAVVFVDVSGHGISAALVAAMIKFSTAFLSEHADDPGRFLTRLNADLCRLLPDDMFAAVFYAVVDLRRERIRYANAGHSPLPVLCSSEGAAALCGGGGLVLGASAETQYETAEAPFGAGACLVLCSDGVSDGRCEREDGVPLPDDLLGVATRSDATAEAIVRQVADWTRRTPRAPDVPEDDETVLVVRRP